MQIKFLLLFILFTTSFCRITHFKMKNRNTSDIFLDHFGFNKNAHIKFQINYLQFGEKFSHFVPIDIGFVFQKIDDPRYDPGDWPACPQAFERNFAIIAKQEEWKKGFIWETTINETQEGEYYIYYLNCENVGVSFDFVMTLYNEGPNYLSSNQFSLPGIYLFLLFLYLSFTSLWTFFIFTNTKQNTVNRIHLVITILLVSQTLSSFFRSIEYYNIKSTGLPKAWNYLRYICGMFKGILAFFILFLIEFRDSSIHRFFSLKEKIFFLSLVSIQSLDYLLLSSLFQFPDEPKYWISWETLFRLIDIICVCLILYQFNWIINHLKSVASNDGKVAKSLEKLKLFKEFYILTVAFIYATQIILILIETTLPFKDRWFSYFFDELATFLFFIYIGYKFRPEPNNPYLKLLETYQKLPEKEAIDAINIGDAFNNQFISRNINENDKNPKSNSQIQEMKTSHRNEIAKDKVN
ncbi:transmembrane receptor [Anaeramoeba ignava]|uniref:Transmembrane receptor n=1 Tax=Anaeramoeba ignava TaxID=1746090 RepID=A0A9Q0RAC1_ANAIG|nr:transmembrane receptor [Anaeramoeba ignava]